MTYPTLPTQFTLLHGPRADCHSFAKTLADNLEPGSIINLDFGSCALDALAGVFYAGNTLEINFDDPETWLKYLPDTKVPLHNAVVGMQSYLRGAFGPDILGRILIRYYRENLHDLCPNVICRDLTTTLDAQVITNAGYSASCINLGPLTSRLQLPPKVRVFWIPNPDPDEAVRYFLNEISNARTQPPTSQLNLGL